MYESRPRVVIFTLGNKLYRIPEVAPPTTISLVTAKQCSKLISKTRKIVFLMICPQEKKKTVATTLDRAPSYDNNKWTRSWRSTRTSSPPPQGCSALSGQALHRSDPRCTTAQWKNLSVLCSGEQRDQEADPGAVTKRSHLAEFITLWEPDRVGIEEGWDLETLY